MAWREWFQALASTDARNADRFNPGGERIRVRLNLQRGRLVDFVVQYETPALDDGRGHHVVLRSDGTHAPHYDRYDWAGSPHATEWLDPSLSPDETVAFVIRDIVAHWVSYRDEFYRGLP